MWKNQLGIGNVNYKCPQIIHLEKMLKTIKS